MVDGDDDSDRAAILARRQRFITLALSGMALGCGDDSGSPMPCLDIGPQTESASTTTPTTGATDSMSGPVDTTADSSAGSSTTGMPMPCLDVAPDSSSGTTDDSSSSTTDATDTGGSGSTGVMPCLVPKG